MSDRTFVVTARAQLRPNLPRSFAFGLALIACLLVTGLFAAPPANGASGNLRTAFSVAARHWQVPEAVLMSVAYVETHWDGRNGEPSEDNGFGVMHVTDRPDGTLARASKLTGLPADAIRRVDTANIEAGAALLHDISQKLRATSNAEDSLESWFPSVALYSGSTDERVADGYAREVFRVVAAGASASTSEGERLTLEPHTVGNLPAPPPAAPASDDYPPALWVPANSGNYTVSRPYGSIDFIVIHDTEGSYASAISWFQNPSSGVSAHYVIRSADGQITQMVRNADTAYHTGVWDYNVRALGIEHEGYMNQTGWYTEVMYQSSSALARSLADRYGVKKDRAHIIGHSQIPNQTHRDPGPNWDWTHYMSLVRRDSVRAALVDNTDSGFVPVPAQVDPQHYWHIYGGGYNNSSSYQTGSVTTPSGSYNSGSWTTQLSQSGNYDVYAFVPYVDNSTPDTASAHYVVQGANGTQSVTVSQQAITDVGDGSWAHLGTFSFTAGANARVSLNDYTGESGRNVWFDAVMWIPSTGGTPVATNTPGSGTATPRPPTATPTFTPRPQPTQTPTFSPTPFPTFTPGPCGMRFWDLPDTHWSYAYVSYLYCNGVISGYADGSFRPSGTTTRAQIAKMIALSFGWTLYNPVVPDFSDVPFGSAYYQFIETCYLHNTLSGYSDGTFRPGTSVTRAQVTKMLVLAKSWIPANPPQPDFSDVPADYWAYGYIEEAYGRGVISGYSDGTFRPGGELFRAQFCKMLALSVQSPSRSGAAPGSSRTVISPPSK